LDVATGAPVPARREIYGTVKRVEVRRIIEGA
jgi:hypothetical protein